MQEYPLDQFQDFLHDESRLIGMGEKIYFPEQESDVQELCTKLFSSRTAIAVQGARTGIVGGAVPNSGDVINLSRMNKILGLRYESQSKQFYLRVQPGISLENLRKAVQNLDFDLENWDEQSLYAFDQMKNKAPQFFPPDPTEDTASLGGMVSTNASGALSYYYGSVRNHIQGLRLVLADGDILNLERKGVRANGRAFQLYTLSGRILEGRLPSYSMPDTKNTAGYYTKDNMDMIDLFIGAEGTLGIVSEMELVLRDKPREIWGLVIFWERESQSIAFVKRVNQMDSMGLRGPQALEYFDYNTMELLRRQKIGNSAFQYLPEIPGSYHDAVYLEFHGSSQMVIEDTFEKVCEFIEEIGGSVDETWLADNALELEKMKQFRHAVPESVNLLLDEKRRQNSYITKLGTDMAVPDARLEDVINLYKQRLEASGLEYLMFGHIGNNHLHVNILPNNNDEYDKGKKEYMSLAREIVQWKGTVAAEHGIGKIKKEFLKMMYGDQGLQEMRDLKKIFDPHNVLSQGNLF